MGDKMEEVVKKREYLMIDLETLDTKPSSLIIQAGLVVFNEEENIDEVGMYFDWIPQIVAGRTVSRDTIEWHRKQGTDLEQLASESFDSLKLLRETLVATKNAYNIKGVWSRGSFDIQILRDAGCFPFPYYMERDCRTLDEIKKMEKKNTHDALGDCQNQIDHVRSCLWSAQAAE